MYVSRQSAVSRPIIVDTIYYGRHYNRLFIRHYSRHCRFAFSCQLQMSIVFVNRLTSRAHRKRWS